MMKRFLNLCIGLFVCLGLFPVTAMAADEDTVYVGGVSLIGSIDAPVYATTDNSGNVTINNASVDNYNIKWDGSTLTLNDSYITKGVSTPDYSSPVGGAAIGMANHNGNAELTIQLEGSNIVAASTGIFVHSSTGAAKLTIMGSGRLTASGSQNGIWVQSNSGNATLEIKTAKVEANGTDYPGNSDVRVQAGSADNQNHTATLMVNGGKLVASGSTGIQFNAGSENNLITTRLSVGSNALVDTRGGGIYVYGQGDVTPTVADGATNGGILFDGKEGTVYGNVSLQEDLFIGEGESLALNNGARLDANNHNVIMDGGTLDVGIKKSLGDKVKYTPTITTTSLPSAMVGQEYNQTLDADGSKPITWSISEGSLPDELTLDPITGIITGTPSVNGTYVFSVQAVNVFGYDSIELSIIIENTPVYSVSVTPSQITLPSVIEGYETQAPKTITIKNNGNQTIVIDEFGKNPWLEYSLTKMTLQPNEETTLSIKLKDGLSAFTPMTAKESVAYSRVDGTYIGNSGFEVSYAVSHDMTHVNAKDPTYSQEGNIEYWYCEYCKKCYKDGAGRNEIALEDTVIPKLTKTGETSQTTNSSQSCAGNQDKNCDGVVTCDEVNGPGWVWSESEKACVLNMVVVPSNTNTIYNFVNTSDR